MLVNIFSSSSRQVCLYISFIDVKNGKITTQIFRCLLLFKVPRIHKMENLLCWTYLQPKFLKTQKFKNTNEQIEKHQHTNRKPPTQIEKQQHTSTNETHTTSELTGSGRRSPEWHGVRGKWCAWKCFFMRLTTYKHKTDYLALLSNELSIYIFVRQWRKLITILS